jgi:hypothetical protein
MGEGEMKMYYLGIFIIIWLLAGLLVGIKHIYVDQILDDESFIKSLMNNVKPRTEKFMQLLTTKKSVYLCTVSLAGFMAVYDEFRLIPKKIEIMKKRRDLNKFKKALAYIDKYTKKK